MRRVIPVLLLIALLFSCNNERSIVDNASKKTLELPSRAAVTADLLVLRQKINQIKALKGAYPQSLDELNIHTNRPAEEYTYNPEKGTVKHRDYPKL